MGAKNKTLVLEFTDEIEATSRLAQCLGVLATARLSDMTHFDSFW